MSKKIILDTAKMRENEEKNDKRFVEFKKEIEKELRFDKLRKDIRNSLKHQHGQRLENGILYQFFAGDDELRVYAFYPEIVISREQRVELVNQAKNNHVSEPLLDFIPSNRFTLRLIEGLSDKKPQVTNLRVDNPEAIMQHVFFLKHFQKKPE